MVIDDPFKSSREIALRSGTLAAKIMYCLNISYVIIIRVRSGIMSIVLFPDNILLHMHLFFLHLSACCPRSHTLSGNYIGFPVHFINEKYSVMVSYLKCVHITGSVRGNNMSMLYERLMFTTCAMAIIGR